MRTKFEYLIDRDENNKVSSRTIQIEIKDKNLQLAKLALNNLKKYIKQEGNYNFANCPWSYKKEGIFGDSINIDNKEEADHIKKLYKEWKKIYKYNY